MVLTDSEKHHLTGIIIGVIIVLAIFIPIAWWVHSTDVEARATMQQTFKDMQVQIEKANADAKQAQQDRKDAQDQLARNASDLQQQISEIRRQASQVRTPQQAATAIGQGIPGVQPIVIQAPGQPAIAQLPAEQLLALNQFKVACDECKANLGMANNDKVELNKEIVADKKENEASAAKIFGLTKERDSAVAAVQGGTFWQRVGRELKSGGGAVVGGATGAAICSKSQPQVIAACGGGGALIGWLAAHIF